MPIFEYVCRECGNAFEIWSDEELKCPRCSSESLQKIISQCNHTSDCSSSAEKQYHPQPGDLVILPRANLSLTQEDGGQKEIPGLVVAQVLGSVDKKKKTLH